MLKGIPNADSLVRESICLVEKSETEMQEVDLETPAKMGVTTDKDKDDQGTISARTVWTSPHYIGVPLNYVGFAIFDTAYSSLSYPLFQNFLNMPQNYINVMAQMPTFFLGLKIFMGMISDSVVIRKKRRKPYIVAGWLGVFLVLMVNSIYVYSHENTLYCYSGEVRLNVTAGGECPPTTDFQTVSVGPEFNANLLAVFAVVGSFFFTVADVATDSYCVELAKHESEENRGQIQSYNMSLRFVFSLFFTLFSNLFFNSPMWGGNSMIQVPMSVYFWIMTGMVGLALPFWFILKEDEVQPGDVLKPKAYLKGLWELTKNHGFGSLLMFQFLVTSLNVSPVGGSGLARHWVGVTPFLSTMSTAVSYVLIFGTIFCMGTWGRQCDWRTLNMVGVGLPPMMGLLTLLIVFDVTRSPGFWFFTTIDEVILSMINWLAAIWAVNEMAPQGLEGTAYAFSSTLHNAAIPLSVTLKNNIGQWTAPDIVAGAFDSPDAQSQYATNVYVCLAINLVALCFLPLFPRQKEEARRRFAEWSSSKWMGMIIIACAGFGMFYPAAVNLLTIWCTCMPVAGGPGCVPGTCTAILG